jgi:hypothetical protein
MDESLVDPQPLIIYDSLLQHELRALCHACHHAVDEREEVLSRLDALLSTGESLSGESLVEEALSAVEGGRVSRLCGHPSTRAIWQVASQALSHKGKGAVDGSSLDLEGSGLTPASEGSHSGPYVYTVLLDGPGLCTCLRFTDLLHQGGSSAGGRLCRHLLAAYIAQAALGTPSGVRVRQKEVSDEDMCRHLLRALCRTPSQGSA